MMERFHANMGLGSEARSKSVKYTNDLSTVCSTNLGTLLFISAP